MARVRAAAIGWRARRALERAAGPARRLGTGSGYLEAGGEIIWVGTTGAPLHGRAVLTDEAPSADDDIDVDLVAARTWRPPTIVRRPSPHALATAGARLRGSLEDVGEPRGLGAWLAGRAPEFPLASIGPAAGCLARACASGEAADVAGAAAALIGLGPGLTPAGDDFVGGACFARAVLAPDVPDPAWRCAVAEVRGLARARTHPVSAALLADLTEGQGWAPLHDLARALAAADDAAALAAARTVVRLGHSSGWDLLAGVLAAVTGGRDL